MIPRIPMVKSIDYETELTKILNSYIYHNVHCRPYSEYRHNIKLHPLFPASKANIVNISSASTRLPASGRWFLYTVENNAIVDIKLPLIKTWTVLGDYYDTRTKKMITGYCTEKNVDIRVVLTNNSRCIPRHCIWVIKNPKANNFIFAIKSDVVTALSGMAVAEAPEVNISFYFHHHDETFRVVGYTNVRLSERNNFFNTCIQEDEQPKIIFINGIECVPKNLEDVFEGCFGEIIYDSSIAGSFTVDITDNTPLAYMGQDQILKYLCHIPKALNEKYDFLNHRVCDVFVHPAATEAMNYTNGLYLNRLNTDKAIFTVTHNDFSISANLVRKYISLGKFDKGCQLKIYVRNHHKGFVLNKDPNYLRELYQLSDEEIIEHLTAKTSHTYWYARNTEVSTWTYFMDNYLEGLTADDMGQCVSCLGYTLSADTLAQRVQHVLISHELDKFEFYIPIPICYLTVDKLTCHVFINGLRVDNDNFRFTKVKQFLKVENLGKLHLEVGTRVTFELFEDVPYHANYVTLKPGHAAIFAPEHEYVIYRRVDLSSTNYVQNKYIYKRFDVSTSYRELTDGEFKLYVSEIYDEATGTTQVTVRNPVQATAPINLLIASKVAYAKLYGVERHLKELNYDIWCSHALKIKATSFVIGYENTADGELQYEGTILIPYINTNRTLLVYLNGKELIRGLDYQDYQILTNRRNVAGQFVILQNVDYLRVASNTFEVFTINEKLVNLDTGFLTKTHSETVLSRMAYYNNLSMIFVDGVAQQYYDNDNYYVDINQEVRPGASYKIRTLVPRCVDDILSLITPVDTVLQNTVAKYIEDKLPDTLEVAPITRSHHIYSTFIQTITEQVLRGVLKVKLSWDDVTIRARLAAYLDMTEFDIAFNSDNKEITDPEQFVKTPVSGLDFRYVDVLPSYRLERVEDSDLTITDKYPIILIRNAKLKEINGNYTCMNPGAQYMHNPRGDHINANASRRWEASNGCYIEHYSGAWGLYTRDGERVCYAEDSMGVDTIWKLDWKPVTPAVGDFTLNYAYMEINTSNEFPIHRLQFTRSIEEYAFLMRVAKMYLKQDLAKDGMNI